MRASRSKLVSRVPDSGPAIVASQAGFRVRPANGADAEALLPLIHRHAAYEQGKASVSAAALRSAFDRRPPLLTAWVAIRADELVGYATATLDFSTWTGRPFLHLDCLFVQENCRGGGVGAFLLAAVRAHAAAQGIPEVQWQTPAWNEDAIRFYRREGASMLSKARFTLSTT